LLYVVKPTLCIDRIAYYTLRQDEGSKGVIDETGKNVEILEIDLLEEAYEHFTNRFDEKNGGFSIAPKFPTPVNLAFLLRLGTFPSTVEDVIGTKECAYAKEMALTTLSVCNLDKLSKY